MTPPNERNFEFTLKPNGLEVGWTETEEDLQSNYPVDNKVSVLVPLEDCKVLQNILNKHLQVVLDENARLHREGRATRIKELELELARLRNLGDTWHGS